MKTRTKFVSNSSSSSFIVIALSGDMCDRNMLEWDNGPLVVDYDFGTTEFGWGPEKISDTPSKICFAYIRALYAEQPTLISMLESVIKEHTKCSEIEWQIALEGDYKHFYYAYIDHQSIEGSDNMEMFNSEDDLKQFLFCKDSYIQLDNDNH
jgi:hypothetical protein